MKRSQAITISALLYLLCSAAQAQMLINSAGDAGRAPNAVPGICDTGATVINPNTGQPVTECTLRALIETLNDGQPTPAPVHVGLVDWIETEGSVPTTVIRPQTPLPPIRWPLHLDGTTHPDFDPDTALVRLVIDGSELPGSDPLDENGLVIQSPGSGSHIEALNIRNFPGVGLAIIANGVQVNHSRIGTNNVGNMAAPNLAGVLVNGSNNIIGNPPLLPAPGPARIARRNVISGNTNLGIQVVGGSNNRIADNYVGTNSAAVAALPNGNFGIVVESDGNLIGDASAFDGVERFAENFVSGHSIAGILVTGSSNQIRCNVLGWRGALTEPLSPNADGIVLRAAAMGNTIGMALCPNIVLASDTALRLGTVDDPIGSDTVIRHNVIGTTPALADPAQTMTAGIDARTGANISIEDNVIGHAQFGVLIGAAASQVEVAGNQIGVAANGTALPVLLGIGDAGSSGTIIGRQNAPNLIGNAPSGGVFLDPDSSGASIAHNHIGITPDGHSAPVGNGIWVDGSGHQIGPGNFIGETGENGIVLQSDGHEIISNRIGTGNKGETWPIGLIGVLIDSDDNSLTDNRIGHAQFGIQISVGRSGNTIQRNLVGTAGGLDFGNALAGLVVAGTDNLIGGPQPAHANQIGFNGGPGIRVTGSDNTFQRNFIGVTANGIAMGNAGPGIEIHPNAGPNLIGGEPGLGNILGNNQDGVLIEADGQTIRGNRIGWTLDGSLHPQQSAGLSILGGVGASLIEGNFLVQPEGPAVVLAANAGAANLIRFNRIGADDDGLPLGGEPGTVGIDVAGGSGTLVIDNRIGYTVHAIDIGASAVDTLVAANALGVLTDGTAMPLAGSGIVNRGQATVIGEDGPPNLIGNTGQRAIHVLPAATSAVIFGNWIGVTPAGHAAPVIGPGIQVSGQGHVIGSTMNNNVIGHASFGISVGISGSGGTGNQIVGNRIGTGFNGESWPITGSTGLNVTSSNNVIRRNVIGNAFNGLQTAPSSQGNLIQRNWIGVDDNLNNVGNQNVGVILGGSNNVLGGILVDPPGGVEANVIGFNQSDAVRLATGSQVVGNWIGMAPDGTLIPNQGGGVIVLPQAEQAVVGASPESGNLIAGNGFGLRLSAPASVGFNWIGGLPSLGFPGNGGHGVEIAAGVSGALIENNRIRNNDGDGIRLAADAGTGNRLSGNLMQGNAGKGIDIGPGGRDQDPGDFDTGPNNLQNFPEFVQRDSGFNPATGQIELRYRVDSDPAASSYPLSVEFFLADSAATGLQGAVFLGSLSYQAADAGQWVDAEFTPPPEAGLQESSLIVATATAADGSTSELSDAFGMLPEFSLGGAIQNLAGTIRLVNEPLEDSIEISAQGDVPFIMDEPLHSGEPYLVSIAPDGMPVGQNCEVFNGEGTVDQGNVSDILVVCSTPLYQLGGQVEGLAGSLTLVNQSNGDQVTVSGSGSVEFVFPEPLADGETWMVVISVQPGGQVCEVTAGASGEIDGADQLGIAVDCTAAEDELFLDRFETIQPN